MPKIVAFLDAELDTFCDAWNLIESCAEHSFVRKIVVLPDFELKSHSYWPSGVVIATEGAVAPIWLNGSGCGMTVLRLKGCLPKSYSDRVRLGYECIKALRDESVSLFDRRELVDSIGKIRNYLQEYTDWNSRINISDWNDYDASAWIPLRYAIRKFGVHDLTGNHFVEFQVARSNEFTLVIHLENTAVGKILAREFGQTIIEGENSCANAYIAYLFLERFNILNRLELAHRLCVVFGVALRDTIQVDAVHDCLSFEDGLWVHRIGAIRVPQNWNRVYLPGSLGAESFWMEVGGSIDQSLRSINHGCGRRLTKKQAEIKFGSLNIIEELARRDIVVVQTGNGDLRRQFLEGYKPVDSVADCMERYDLARRAQRLSPKLSIKN